MTISITGTNFGVHNPLRQQPAPGSVLDLSVRLVNLVSANGLPDSGAALDCGDAVRVSQTQITCTS